MPAVRQSECETLTACAGLCDRDLSLNACALMLMQVTYSPLDGIPEDKVGMPQLQ